MQPPGGGAHHGRGAAATARRSQAAQRQSRLREMSTLPTGSARLGCYVTCSTAGTWSVWGDKPGSCDGRCHRGYWTRRVFEGQQAHVGGHL